jgi:hypothetical protein
MDMDDTFKSLTTGKWLAQSLDTVAGALFGSLLRCAALPCTDSLPFNPRTRPGLRQRGLGRTASRPPAAFQLIDRVPKAGSKSRLAKSSLRQPASTSLTSCGLRGNDTPPSPPCRPGGRWIRLLLCVALMLVIPLSGRAADDSGTFRAKWWNYYGRGVGYSENSEWEKAATDLKKALTLRAKDQRMARTYGMHFIDYFPHRELGIVYLGMGETDKAFRELEESIRQEESARAIYYLNKGRKARLAGQPTLKPPIIALTSPSPGTAVAGLFVKVMGKASGEAYIARITVNNEPIRFDLSKQEVPFEKEVPVSDGAAVVVVVAEDLLGRRCEKTTSLIVDREGPNINIADVIAEVKDGRRVLRVTGEVTDETGIRQVFLNDKSIEVGGSKTYEFSVSIERGAPSARLTIQALDVLGNDTKAEIDPEKELTAFRRLPLPVMLASNAKRIFSLDKEPPVIALKEAGEIPSVFVDRYYVEGEISDNSRVEKVVINNREVSTKGGKKIFFSKVIRLSEGTNRIVVDAFDSADNKATSTIVVKRQIPNVLQVGSRVSVSLLPFDTRQKDSNLTRIAYDELVGSFVDQKRFRVIERAKLEQILLEQKLTKEKLTDPEHSIRVGKLMAAETILATSVNEGPKAVEITSRLVNTETSEVLGVKDVFTEEKNPSAIKELMEGLAAKVASTIPMAEGMVINREGSTVFTDLSSSMNVKKDMGLIIYRKGKEIKHPVTGKSLGWDTVKVGEGTVEEVRKDFSKARLSAKAKADDVRVKDLVITK